MAETPRVMALLPRGSDACLLWRHWWPSAEMKRHGFVAEWRYAEQFRSLEPELLSGAYNLIVMPRFVWKESWMLERFQHTLNQIDAKLVYETDDDFFSPEIIERHVGWNMLRYPYHKRAIEHEINVSVTGEMAITAEEYAAAMRAEAEWDRVERIRMVNMTSAMTVSSDQLAISARKYINVPIHVVPNAMDIAWFRNQMRLSERTIPPLTIGWTGGFRPEADIAVLAEAWKRIAKQFPEVTFVLHGWAVPSIIEVMPVNRIRVLPWCDIADYPAILKNIDIGCCSVAPTEWNEAKTSIKWMELSMAGAACVASHALYGRDVTDGHDGLLATTADEWEHALARLVRDATLRRTLQLAAVDTITRDHNLANAWVAWRDTWTRCLASPNQKAVVVANSARTS